MGQAKRKQRSLDLANNSRPKSEWLIIGIFAIVLGTLLCVLMWAAGSMLSTSCPGKLGLCIQNASEGLSFKIARYE